MIWKVEPKVRLYRKSCKACRASLIVFCIEPLRSIKKMYSFCFGSTYTGSFDSSSVSEFTLYVFAASKSTPLCASSSKSFVTFAESSLTLTGLKSGRILTDTAWCPDWPTLARAVGCPCSIALSRKRSTKSLLGTRRLFTDSESYTFATRLPSANCTAIGWLRETSRDI